MALEKGGSPCCCCCCRGPACTGEPVSGSAQGGGTTPTATRVGAAVTTDSYLRQRALKVCSRTKKIPLLTEAVEETVRECSSCRCWEAATIAPENRSFYCCLCMQVRKRNDCIFWASPWRSSFRTFAAFSDPIDADAAAAEHQELQPSRSSSSNANESETSSTEAPKKKGTRGKKGSRPSRNIYGKLWRVARAAIPLSLVFSALCCCWSITGPLPQVVFLLGAFFSCIPVADAIAALVRVREERLTIIGDFGVQWSFKKFFGASRRFVPMSQVKDVIISEEVHVYRVAYHVAIVVGDKQELIVPFQDFELRLEDCLAVYEALHCLLRTQIRGAAKSCTSPNVAAIPRRPSICSL
ncbi:hypothetical protein, conserved [Eimeria tenella]|uniref:Phosphatidylinositol N-acetylglucosaminyltransferase subunit H conserved domain-containing protein n=1 Tax=Eimeria tenella TaxID=5802 RepID=U6KPC1_EIMTE|nr:hypothetical protein, conserved [Eimeria tenella]CDJ38758.1 hypothetical protein, conserved [Eimeria tenella]|eukprot:XP_013229514.1 hypothetical protein, conserved [Eimeria tenella]